MMRPLVRLAAHPAFPGLVLLAAAAVALILANSGLSAAYHAALNQILAITLDGQGLQKPLILWINDGLMALFFLHVGLELKREVLEGRLRQPRDVLLPGLAALGGMAMPALIFVAVNWNSPENLRGWAIPAATDIAFALGVLALMGRRVPAALKVFLLTLAILDDLGAILIIALFYTDTLKAGYLLAALVPLAGLVALNLRGSHRMAPILILGVLLWLMVLRSGVHATLAGVLIALAVPLRDRFGKSPLHALEHGLTPYVNYLILPLFALANAGVVLAELSLSSLTAPLPLGIALGLILGKMAGVLGAVWLTVRLGLGRLPGGAGWLHMAGIAALAGIGFTMSLFIGGLSFADPAQMNQVRAGVLGASVLAGLLGYALLSAAARRAPA